MNDGRPLPLLQEFWVAVKGAALRGYVRFVVSSLKRTVPGLSQSSAALCSQYSGAENWVTKAAVWPLLGAVPMPPFVGYQVDGGLDYWSVCPD